MKWEDDYTFEDAPPLRGLSQLTMYAQHLGSGDTLLCRSIEEETIKKYILSAAQFLGLFGDQPRDFHKEYPTSTIMAPDLTKVHTELERWVKVPKRREPLTLEMLADMHEHFDASDLGPDSKLAALVGWIEVGLFAGSRLCDGHKMPKTLISTIKEMRKRIQKPPPFATSASKVRIVWATPHWKLAKALFRW